MNGLDPNTDEVGEHFLQPRITGYRQLNVAEAALMNEAKAVGAMFENVVSRVKAHLDNQKKLGTSAEELTRFYAAEPERWAAMARTDSQTAVMKLCRAIAQPAS